MKNLLMLVIVAVLMAGCTCPLKEKCCKSAQEAKSSQHKITYEDILHQTYKFEMRKISIITEPSGADVYQITDTQGLKYLGKSPLQDKPVMVLTGINEGISWTADKMNYMGSHFGVVELLVLQEGYVIFEKRFSTDPNTAMPYNIKLLRFTTN